MRVLVNYTDNINLSQAKFDLHSNFDCHGHGRLTQQNVWQVIETVELEGNEMSLDKEFIPPSDVRPGNYHFAILGVDEKGNAAESVYFDVQVVNSLDTIPPNIVLNTPDSSVIYSRIHPLIISGSIIDETDMALGEISVSILDGEGSEFNFIRDGFGPDPNTDVSFYYEFNIGSSFISGACNITIEASDGLNNKTVITREFTLVD